MIYSSQRGLEAVMFEVSEVGVFAETSPGCLERIDGKKAIVNSDSSRVLAVVGQDYRILRNRVALDLAQKCCTRAFPDTEPTDWEVVEVEAPLTGSSCRIDLRHTGEDLREDWAFRKGKTDLYEPFFRVTNSYNRTKAFSIHFGVRRLACTNGQLHHDSLRIKLDHDTPRIEEEIERKITEAKFGKALRELRRERGKLRRTRIPPRYFRPIILSVLGITEPNGLRQDHRSDWQLLERVIDGTRDRYLRSDRHRPFGGANALTLADVLTDLTTRPPIPGRDLNGSLDESRERARNDRPIHESWKSRYPFIRRDRHTLQRRTGIWMRWFSQKCGSLKFLKEYMAAPRFPTRTDLRFRRGATWGGAGRRGAGG